MVMLSHNIIMMRNKIGIAYKKTGLRIIEPRNQSKFG